MYYFFTKHKSGCRILEIFHDYVSDTPCGMSEVLCAIYAYYELTETNTTWLSGGLSITEIHILAQSSSVDELKIATRIQRLQDKDFAIEVHGIH